jgi:hypothetical protein
VMKWNQGVLPLRWNDKEVSAEKAQALLERDLARRPGSTPEDVLAEWAQADRINWPAHADGQDASKSAECVLAMVKEKQHREVRRRCYAGQLAVH